MNNKLEAIKQRYETLSNELAAPGAAANQDAWRMMTKEHAELSPIVNKYEAYAEVLRHKEECRTMLQEHLDGEMKEMVLEELSSLSVSEEELFEQLRQLLAPRDPNDDKDVIIEVRAGTGGEEAALFGADLVRMYQRYAERNGYKLEFITSSLSEKGGVKEVIFSLGGKRGAYSKLKFESGVHRVQRVPETEAQGRIHTSAATVAVLPEAEDVEVDIKESDLRIDTYRSSGAGGQHVNKTDSAIRITHLPSGLVVACQDERSQLKNKEQAMRLLKSRLFEMYQAEQDEALAKARKSQVGSGDRSERIRTYNFPQGRVTDHRIGLTLYKLEQFLDGDMDEMIDALSIAERAARLAHEQ